MPQCPNKPRSAHLLQMSQPRALRRKLPTATTTQPAAHAQRPRCHNLSSLWQGRAHSIRVSRAADLSNVRTEGARIRQVHGSHSMPLVRQERTPGRPVQRIPTAPGRNTWRHGIMPSVRTTGALLQQLQRPNQRKGYKHGHQERDAAHRPRSGERAERSSKGKTKRHSAPGLDGYGRISELL